MTHLTFAQRQQALRLGHRRLSERPPNLGLDSESVAYRTHAPVLGQHRDSEALERSNYTVVSTDLLGRFGSKVSAHAPACEAVGTDWDALPCDCPPDVVVETFRHWAVGWTESLLVRVDAHRVRPTDLLEPTEAWLEAVEWLEALEAYPVADEDHYSQLELDEACEYVASELDGLEGGWTQAVIEQLLDSPCGLSSELSWADIETALESVWVDHTIEAVRSTREWLSLRQAGDGQLTLEGETVSVSAEPPQSLSELEQLDPDSVDAPIELGRLLERRTVVTGSDGTEVEAQALLESLRDVLDAVGARV